MIILNINNSKEKRKNKKIILKIDKTAKIGIIVDITILTLIFPLLLLNKRGERRERWK